MIIIWSVPERVLRRGPTPPGDLVYFEAGSVENGYLTRSLGSLRLKGDDSKLELKVVQGLEGGDDLHARRDDLAVR